MEEKHYTIEKQVVELGRIETGGLILDIGGGGEGVIGRLSGRQVVAIDTRIEELREARNDSLRIVMDATDLGFLASSFDVATSFFSLMYIENDRHLRAFKEVHRVLKDKGVFFVWDVEIPPGPLGKDIFVVPLKVLLPSETIETSYGVTWPHKKHDRAYFWRLAGRAEFKIVDDWQRDKVVYLKLIKHV